ncbi:MAG: sensor histidine kinase [Bacillota bacterium]
MTRWYLNDYPVYVRAEDYGLLVLGIPKNSVGKYDIQYSMDWFDALPQRILIIFAVNLILAALLACLFGRQLYKKLKNLTSGIQNLRLEKRVHLKEKGIFKELSKNINETSENIDRKNDALLSRDNARSNWIAGISHDIRTPLSMIMGYSETLANASEISEANRKKANIITAQSIKMKKLIEDLNLISSLEYDMQPSKKKAIRLCPLLRNTITEIINNGLSEKYEINLNFQHEQAVIMGDETLLERAFFNLINNSIIHNTQGCAINISEYAENGTAYINISDNGSGVPDDVIENIAVIPKTSHGLGLPMAYKVFYVHGGKMQVKNDNGFSVMIELPIS